MRPSRTLACLRAARGEIGVVRFRLGCKPMRHFFGGMVVGIWVLGAWHWASPAALATQDPAAPVEARGAEPSHSTPAATDPRYHSPRATVRTFLAAINATTETPTRIKDAIACLDLSEAPTGGFDMGRLAFQLEHVLRSLRIPTLLIPEAVSGSEYTLGDQPEFKITLRRGADGRWLFDSQTIKDLPRMRMALHRKAMTAPPHDLDDDVPSDFRSPNAMFLFYMTAMKKGDIDAAARCLDLSAIPAPARKIVGRSLAVKIKEVLDRTIFVIFQDVPDTSRGEPLEAVVREEGRIVVERQPTGPRKGEWVFNRETIESLDRLHDAYGSRPVVPELQEFNGATPSVKFRHSSGLWLKQRLPNWLKQPFRLSPRIWLSGYQLFGLLVLPLAAWATHRLAARVTLSIGGALARWRGIPDDSDPIAGLAVSLGWLASLWVLVQGVVILDLHHDFAGTLLSFLVPVYYLVGTVAAFRLVDPLLALFIVPVGVEVGHAHLVTMGVPVISLVLKIAVLVVGLAAVLESFNFDVATVLAGLGIGGIAFALAAQDTLKNFFGSLMLIADRTFRVGDQVRIGANEGMVESVGLRSTRIRGLDDALLTIPNSDLTTAHVANFGARRYRQFRTRVGVPSGTPVDEVIRFRDSVRELVQNDPNSRPDTCTVLISELGSATLEIRVEVILDVADARAEAAARDRLILAIVRRAQEMGVVAMSAPSGAR